MVYNNNVIQQTSANVNHCLVSRASDTQIQYHYHCYFLKSCTGQVFHIIPGLWKATVEIFVADTEVYKRCNYYHETAAETDLCDDNNHKYAHRLKEIFHIKPGSAGCQGTNSAILQPIYRSTCISWQGELKNFVGAKFHCRDACPS